MWCIKVSLLIEEVLLLNPLSTKIIGLLFDMHKLQYKKENKHQDKKIFRQFHHMMSHVYHVTHLFPKDYEPIVTTTEELTQIHDCIIAKARKLNLL